MSTNYWWIGALLFLFSLGLHAIVWRGKPSKRSFRLLFLIFLLPGVFLFGAVLFDPNFLFASLINLICSANYIAIYPAFQASSPSIKILNLLFERKTEIEKEKLFTLFPKKSLIYDRYYDLKESGLLLEDDNSWQLTVRAKTIVRLFSSYRTLLGLAEGRG